MMSKRALLVSFTVFILSALLLACTASQQAKPKSESEKSKIEEKSKEEKRPPVLKKGETAVSKSGNMKYSVASIREASVIDEKNNQFLVAQPRPDNKFVMVTFTIENAGTSSDSYNLLFLSPKIIDQDGYAYESSLTDLKVITALANALKPSGDVIPQTKVSGEIPFEIPTTKQPKYFYIKDVKWEL